MENWTAYGELEPIVRFSECSGFLINCDSSCNEAHDSNLLPFLGHNWYPRAMKHQGLVVFMGGPPGDPRMAFGFDGPLLVGVVFFPSSPFMGVMLFPSFVR